MDANLAWLIELGYTVLTRVHSGHATRRLQRGIGDAAVWERVGANVEALALGKQRIGAGRYILQALQMRSSNHYICLARIYHVPLRYSGVFRVF
jgi:hypothetical protein